MEFFEHNAPTPEFFEYNAPAKTYDDKCGDSWSRCWCSMYGNEVTSQGVFRPIHIVFDSSPHKILHGRDYKRLITIRASQITPATADDGKSSVSLREFPDNGTYSIDNVLNMCNTILSLPRNKLVSNMCSRVTRDMILNLSTIDRESVSLSEECCERSNRTECIGLLQRCILYRNTQDRVFDNERDAYIAEMEPILMGRMIRLCQHVSDSSALSRLLTETITTR